MTRAWMINGRTFAAVALAASALSLLRCEDISGLTGGAGDGGAEVDGKSDGDLQIEASSDAKPDGDLQTEASSDAKPGGDAQIEAGGDAQIDAGGDAQIDAGTDAPRDAQVDTGTDGPGAGDAGAEADVTPDGDAQVDTGPDGAALCTSGCPTTCAAILAMNPSAPDGVYSIDTDGAGPSPPFLAYCDMTTDDGGWTLLITLTSSTLTTSPPLDTVADWPSTFDTVGGAPGVTGMYKGTLAPFHDVREEIASGLVKSYGQSKTEADLNVIRTLYAYDTRTTVTVAELPPCRTSYGVATDDLVGCSSHADPIGDSMDTVIGWAVDPPPTTGFCWFARGDYSNGSPTLPRGSALCTVPITGDPNGTTWARTWFR